MSYKETLPYDKTDPISIYEYALPLIDHTLREIVGDANVLSSTNDQQKHIGNPLLCTTHNYTNRSNHHRDSFLNCILANGWNAGYLQDDDSIVALYQVPSLMLRASAPS